MGFNLFMAGLWVFNALIWLINPFGATPPVWLVVMLCIYIIICGLETYLLKSKLKIAGVSE